MIPKWKYNLLIAPVAIPFRAILLLPLMALAIIGEKADRAYEYLNWNLPGLKR